MQSPIIPKKPSASLSAAAAILAAFAAFSFSACDKEESPSGPSSNAMITISSPAKGEVYNVGDSLRIKWTVKDDPADPIDGVTISLSPDGGITWGGLEGGSVAPTHATWGNYAWKVKDSLYIQGQAKNVLLKGSTQCKIRVQQYTTNDPLRIINTEAFSIK
jgi:hypothetical protein